MNANFDRLRSPLYPRGLSGTRIGSTVGRTSRAFLALITVLTAMLTGCVPQSPGAFTIAATASSADPAVELTADLRTQAREHAAAALRPGDGMVGIVVQGRIGVYERVDLTPMRGKEVEADPTKAAKRLDQLWPFLSQALNATHSATDGVDTLGVLAEALQVTPTGTVAVISSGISTVDPVDLRKGGDWMLDPEGFADVIAREHLPNAQGRRIVFVGLGYPAPGSRQPVPGTAAREALVRLWTRVCQRTEALSCQVLPGPAGTAPSTATSTVPVVTFNRVDTECVGTIEIPSEVTFRPESAILTAVADLVLAPLARSLSRCPADRVVNAVGHTAEVPGAGNGMALSQQRAVAVLQRLGALGVPASALGTATGVGHSAPRVDNTPNGVYDEALARLNRYVEITISTLTK